MTVSRRRLLLAGASVGLLGGGLAGCSPDDTGAAKAQGGSVSPSSPPAGAAPSGPAPAPQRIRYDVASEQGQAMLAIYAKGVAAMTALQEGDPLNWSFQWYSHWVKGDLDASGKASEMARVYGGAPSAARTLAQKMWDGCQAHGPNEDEDFFLPWHRMFVFAFETIIRRVTGEASFTLPYWNYTDPSAYALPEAFRMPNDPVFGALYRATRNPGVNAGQPIADGDALNLQILSEETYSANGADAGFCQGLDNGLHGAVHVAVGNATTGMGVVPWAASDPIFWLHHCNIDRIWASWNAAGHANPTDPAFLAKPFPFAGPDGQEVDYLVANFLDIAKVGYAYDQLAGVAPTPLQAPSTSTSSTSPAPPAPQTETRALQTTAPPAKAEPVVTHANEDITLGRSAVRVQLAPAVTTPDVAARAAEPLTAPAPRLMRRTPGGAPIMGAAPAPIASAPTIPAPGPGQRVFVVVSDLSTDIQPGVLYAVYLDAPGAGGSTQAFNIGTLNFFSAMGSGMRMKPRQVSFDITELAAQLAKEGRLSTTPVLAFSPRGAPKSAAQPLIGAVSVVVQ